MLALVSGAEQSFVNTIVLSAASQNRNHHPLKVNLKFKEKGPSILR